ncbi:hypothetical protein WJX73_002906 [Symbiochloris irregularis]|uniref:Chromatin modification-related protein MEAF6 n=1 Tax=Symbiochloris irregularis TaxID=706552 RepID=A0AAW1NVB7_9CHLO
MALEALAARKSQLETELAKVEKNLYDLETAYLGAEHAQYGTALKGFEAVLSSKDAMRKRPRQFKLEDRLFSLSSCSSPARKELEQHNFEEADARSLFPSRAAGAMGSKGLASKGRRV